MSHLTADAPGSPSRSRRLSMSPSSEDLRKGEKEERKRKEKDEKEERRKTLTHRGSSSSLKSPTSTRGIDPAILKEMALKAKHLSPTEATEQILQQVYKIDPTYNFMGPNTQNRKDSTVSPPASPKKTEAQKSTSPKEDNIAMRVNRTTTLSRLAKVDANSDSLRLQREKIAKRHSKKLSEADKIGRVRLEVTRKEKSMDRNDTKYLEGISIPDELVISPHQIMEPKPEFNFDDYRTIYNLATSTEGMGHVPEIVLVGMCGTGKSSVLESLVGQSINLVGFKSGGKSKRPLYVHLVSNELCETPKCSILSNEGKSATIPLASLPAEISKLQENTFTPEPIHLQFEYSQCLNLLIIDTPGLPFESDSDEFGQIEVYLNEAVRPPHRLIACVEEFDQLEWDTSPGTSTIRSLIRRVDPHEKRTVTVLNKLALHLERMTCPSEFSTKLKLNASNVTYWTTHLSGMEHNYAIKSGDYLPILAKLEERDRQNLLNNRVESCFFDHLGTSKFRRFVMEWCWKSYYTTEVPKLTRNLQTLQKKAQQNVEEKEFQVKNINLRKLAADYSSEYIQIAQGIMMGDPRGSPAVNGETLREEQDNQFFASVEWEIPSRKSVPFEHVKLYGGQQIERIFGEFSLITDALSVTDFSAVLPRTDSKFYYSLCETVSHTAERSLVPLVEQLIDRIVFVLKRIPDIVQLILKSKKKQFEISGKHFSPLATYLKDLFSTSVQKHADITKQRSMEEFYPIKTTMWYMSTIFPPESISEEEKTCQDIFSHLKDRVVKNVVRKVYNLLLVPFYRDELWEEIQTHMSTLEELNLEEIFELSSIQDILDHELEILEIQLEKYLEDGAMLKDIVKRIAF
eukprot:TRINITY_DN6186_c0_g1_i1.p1 TRINITY_DN6186_c0_g1~~TRINITY_DN6186_c0_g1_i1.p1  ORF type:complete len:855 (-),score=281.86 TRINITY_DN6186_c0_g1_i1:35-2599(-)